ncbi:SRPBCC domain-containing protein [Phytohabitans suffuscus]|uniref:Vanillate O-demethylase oxidoreductase VanB n=1 Tax=Phytohabitans suffuscus TaxID=624315 RepID=A0A6F8YBI7_9ACTN|nr:SRPBCC domain-containing protein [Phytohabitans suffuscus]BCB83321.1 vanillate O-demethylase oxidoreductase VanB [Phytohabitans suffuscus]
MTFPDRIERTLNLAQAPERVWAALTTAEGLGTWFGNSAEVDLRVGGQAKLTWDSGDSATLTIERLEPPHVFGYTWPIHGLPADDPRRTYVEFTLEPAGSGTTLTMVETGFAQLPEVEHKAAFPGNTQGWTSELGELVAYLDGQA